MIMRKVWTYLKTRRGLSNLVVLCSAIAFYLLLENFTVVRTLLTSFLSILAPILYGAIIAYLLHPIAAFISDKLFGRMKARKAAWALGVLLTVVIALSLVVLLSVAIVPQLLSSVSILIINAEGYFASFKRTLSNWAQSVAFLELDVQALVGSWSAIFTDFSNWVRENILAIVDASVKVGSGVINLFLSLILSIYILLDKHNLLLGFSRFGRSIMSEKIYHRAREILQMSNLIFMRFISVSLMDALVVGVASFVFMSMIGMPYPLLISAIVGVTNLIPTFGPIIGAVISVLIILIIKPILAFWFLVWVVVIQIIDVYVIKSFVFKDPSGLRPLWVLVAIIVGGRLFGFPGMVIGIPVLGILSKLIEQGVNRRLRQKGLDVDAEVNVADPTRAPEGAPSPKGSALPKQDK